MLLVIVACCCCRGCFYGQGCVRGVLVLLSSVVFLVVPLVGVIVATVSLTDNTKAVIFSPQADAQGTQIQVHEFFGDSRNMTS